MTISRRLGAAVLAAGVTAALTGLSGLPARADDLSYVKYYTVTTSYQGKKEDLAEIASRFLGSDSRSLEIYNLNVGREQPDGKALNDAEKLDPGWKLVLPWDAVGASVQYGTLSGDAPEPTPTGSKRSPTSKTPSSATGGGTSAPAGSPRSSGSASAGAAKPGVQATNPPAASGAKCTPPASAGKQPDWARQKLDADRAWSRTKGTGEVIAIVDSGVDGSLAPLTGHVLVGVDVVSGSGRGDVDCVGSGTAMGAIAVAQPGKRGALAGIAPGANVMPVRVVTTSPKVEPSDEATAITVATSAGATVIALGSYVDTADPKVAAAIKQAVDHDVVVVCAAPDPNAPIDPDTALPEHGVLRVGGVGEDGQLVASYRTGAVDVVAPGAAVSTLGVTGVGTVVVTGTQYAVAFVAGEVALVRAAYPNLPAVDVADRVKDTAGAADSRAGGGRMMDVSSAVTAALNVSGGGSRRPTPSSGGGGQIFLLTLIGAVLMGALIVLIIRVRRLLRADDVAGTPGTGGETESGNPPRPVPPKKAGAR